MKMNYAELCLQVCEIARTVGHFIVNERKCFDTNRVEHKGLTDLVSYVDREAEVLIVNALEKFIPDAGFIGEEGTSSKRGLQYNWVVDPLDGTTNFVHGTPIYAVSIGLLNGDDVVLGVVYELGRDECFYAWKGGGAFLNGERISVSTRTTIGESIIGTGFPYVHSERVDRQMEIIRWCTIHSRSVRILGTAATDLCYVACGRHDVYFEFGLQPWDVAAGIIIIQEAGGLVSDFTGGTDYVFGGDILATNGNVDKVMLAQLVHL
jgi:myo-inositol-1(or 4)-monophosphatase